MLNLSPLFIQNHCQFLFIFIWYQNYLQGVLRKVKNLYQERWKVRATNLEL